MSIQLIWLRPETPGGEIKRGKQKHMFTRPVVFAPSVQNLFENIKDYVAKIPADERWNTYYTVGSCGKKIRDVVQQEVLAFDIDGVNQDRLLDYAPIIAARLGVPEDQMAITSSGNGLHFILQLEAPIPREEIIPLQPHYKEVIRLLDQDVKNAGLTGHFDMILDTSRILRLPFTENRKPKGTTQAKLIQCDFTPHALDLRKLSGLPEVSAEDAVDPKEARKRFSRPDTETVLSECQFLRWTKEHGGEVKEPHGYAALSIIARLENGPQLAKEYIAGWNGSGSIAQWDPETKISQALGASGPRTCRNLQQFDKCGGCPHLDKVQSPIALKGPNYIATEGNGFHDTVVTEKGEKLVPNCHDLRLYFERQAPYKVIDRKMIYRWDGKVYQEIHQLALRVFAEENFNPKVKKGIIDEFEDVVARYNVVAPDWFAESTEGLVNFQNTVMNWKTGELLPHDPERGFRTLLPFQYDPAATAPRWEQFLGDIFEGDEAKAKLIEEYLGYCLSGDRIWDEKAMILVGQGANGKSTLLSVLQELAGRDNFSAVKADLFSKPEAVQALDGKLFNVSGETPRRGFEETSGFKELVSGTDAVTGRKLYGQPFYFINRAKIIFSCNEIPKSQDNTHGFYRKFWVVEFTRQFDPAKGDGDFSIKDKLRAELPGIFNRVRAAYQAAKDRRAFTEPKAVVEALENLREEMDVVGTWIRDNVREVDGEPVRVTLQELWERFSADMAATGNARLREFYNTQRLSARVARVFHRARRFRTNAMRGFEGIKLETRQAVRH